MSDAINPQHYKRLPAEAIEIIESAIDNAPSNRDALLHGQALKYLLRCWNKNGIEDLRKAKWYLNRLIDSFDASEAEQLATGEATGEVTVEGTGEGTGEVKPPDGWRWLEVGEVIRNGDRFFCGTDWKDRNWAIGEKYSPIHRKTIRRNKFEVGEKVIECVNNRIGVVQCEIGGGKYVAEYEIEMLDTKRARYFFPHNLAPYIEDAT